MPVTFSEIRSSSQLKRVIQTVFGIKKVELIQRPASFIFKLEHEPEERVFRIILLPPHGYTSNEKNRTSPHPEVRQAKIEIKGGIRPEKSGFSILKNVFKYQYYTKRDIKTGTSLPYPKIGGKHYQERTKSSKEKFFVVGENGSGFYHNLVNLSGEWLLLILDKELRVQKNPDVKSAAQFLPKKDQKTFLTLYKQILIHGDELFERQKSFIARISNFDVAQAIPPLIEMLNVLETGKHEPCTVFGIILKISKKNKKLASKYLKEAVRQNRAPKYYLRELLQKLQ